MFKSHLTGNALGWFSVLFSELEGKAVWAQNQGEDYKLIKCTQNTIKDRFSISSSQKTKSISLKSWLGHLKGFLYSKELNYGFLSHYLLSLVTTQVHGKVFKVMFIPEKRKFLRGTSWLAPLEGRRGFA